jgi:hypothetical protein
VSNPERKPLTRAEAGRLGGQKTLEKYGIEHFRHLGNEHGHKGGRPRSLTLAEIRKRDHEVLEQRLAMIEKQKKEIDPRGKTNSLYKLKQLYKLKLEENKIRATLDW